MIRRPPRSTLDRSSAASDVYKRQGYRGRKCITEFLDLTDEIKEMILADRALSEIRYRAVTDGMITLRQSAVKKVLALSLIHISEPTRPY